MVEGKLPLVTGVSASCQDLCTLETAPGPAPSLALLFPRLPLSATLHPCFLLGSPAMVL